VGRCQWFGPAREDQRQPLAVLAAGLHSDRFALTIRVIERSARP
jgi:hypothetical protein